MVKHIVMWRLHDEALGKTCAQNANLLKQKLEALSGKIPGLLKIEVGFDDRAGADIVLYSELESREALEAYRTHPEHQAVIPLVKSVTADRRVVDYEV
ncbi:MAG: Dabb family protein [Nitrospiria bacterium]